MVWRFCLLLVFLPPSTTLGEDTVAEDMGIHQLERLVEMLTIKECEDLLFTLSHPEDSIFKHLDQLSPENNKLDLKNRAKRDTSTAGESETECQTALTDWLLRYGQETYHDRLSRALQHIGRTDIAIEVGKSINQDKISNMKHYVEDYHKFVESLNSPDKKDKQQAHQRVRIVKARDLTWRDLDLIVVRTPVPAYQKGILDVALPLLYGLLLGFGGTLFGGGVLLLIFLHVSRKRPQSCHRGDDGCEVTASTPSHYPPPPPPHSHTPPQPA
ncbi:transmembrane and death domain protein 1 [Brachyistius frenatus]|uniref:transmembrane and death domain protein 1 n=1 Tax=Brachyistius frenatus TaxID=100188 RepID=UPI0037E841AD